MAIKSNNNLRVRLENRTGEMVRAFKLEEVIKAGRFVNRPAQLMTGALHHRRGFHLCVVFS
jgi:hypothetical protein